MPSDRQTGAPFQLEPPPSASPPRKRYKRPAPRFLTDRSNQLDAVSGCPAVQVPGDHLAWRVRTMVEQLDTSSLEKGYSSLGRRGFHPRFTLAVWIYASLIGMHEASKVARALKTDLAFRLLSGGREMSASSLKNFRRDRADFLALALDQSTAMGVRAGLVNPEQLAVDSMRIQSDASPKTVRTLKRSRSRLEELAEVDTTVLTPEAAELHRQKVEKHKKAVERCVQEDRTSHSTTDPGAALMKFPSGAALPGHRVTATSSGTDVRFAVSVLINSSPTDFGQLENAVRDAHAKLLAAGMPIRPGAPRMQIAADPGYLSEADLLFADANRDWVDVLIHQPAPPTRKSKDGKEEFFGREHFHIHPDDSATCPAGRRMKGPRQRKDGYRYWMGDGCVECPLKSRCTDAKERTFMQNPEIERLHDAMRVRMALQGAKERYNRRIATIEPVFSSIEDSMQFRRSSSRDPRTVRGEILLKFLAHNLMRLAAAAPALLVTASGVATDRGLVLLCAWTTRRSDGDTSAEARLLSHLEA